MARKSPLSQSALDLLNGRTAGGPLGPDYARSKEIALGDRLDELSKMGIGSVTITAGDSTGTVSFGSAFANAKCVGSKAADTAGTATVVQVSDCDANGDCTVTLDGAVGGGESVTVNVMADAR